MKSITGKIDAFKAFPKEGKHGAYFNHSYTIGGKYYTKSNNSEEPLYTVGSTVLVLFQENKSGEKVYNNIETITLSEETGETTAPTVENTPQAPTKTTTTTKTKTTTGVAVNNAPNKDVSMEVSGLAQALITVGVPVNKLQENLIEVLKIKRAVAKRTEAGEFDYVTPIKADSSE